MSIIKSINDLERHRDKAIQKVEKFLNNLIQSGDNVTKSKADKFSYWLEDYISFLEFEKCFDSKKMKKYKRGEIIKVHLGYNIGSEEGGLHYCVVMDIENSLTSPVITVIPLISVKQSTDIKNLKNYNIYLGNELFQSMNSKLMEAKKSCIFEMDKLQKIMDEGSKNNNLDLIKEMYSCIYREKKRKKVIHEIITEISKMEKGSIALTNQITTVSKIRIYNPKTNKDILSNIRLSNEKLDLLDEAIITRYTKVSVKK